MGVKRIGQFSHFFAKAGIRRPASGAAWQTCITLIQIGIAVGLPQFLSFSVIGKYIYLTTLLNTALLLGGITSRQTIERNYSRLWFVGSKDEASDLLYWILFTRLGLTLITAFIVISIFRNSDVLGGGSQLMGLFLASVIFRTLSESLYSVLISLGKVTDAFLPQLARMGLRLPFVILGYRWTGDSGLIAGILMGEIVTFIVSVLKAFPWFQLRRRLGKFPKALFGFTLGVAGYSVAVIGLNYGIILGLAGVSKESSEIVPLGMGWQFSLLVLNIYFVAYQTLLPSLAEHWDQKNYSVIGRYWINSNQLTWLSLTFLTGCCSLFGSFLIQFLFGEKYLGVHSQLTLGLAVITLWAATSTHFNMLFGSGRSKSVCLSMLAIAITGIGLSFLTPKLALSPLSGYLIAFLLGYPMVEWISKRELNEISTQSSLGLFLFCTLTLMAFIETAFPLMLMLALLLAIGYAFTRLCVRESRYVPTV